MICSEHFPISHQILIDGEPKRYALKTGSLPCLNISNDSTQYCANDSSSLSKYVKDFKKISNNALKFSSDTSTINKLPNNRLKCKRKYNKPCEEKNQMGTAEASLVPVTVTVKNSNYKSINIEKVYERWVTSKDHFYGSLKNGGNEEFAEFLLNM